MLDICVSATSTLRSCAYLTQPTLFGLPPITNPFSPWEVAASFTGLSYFPGYIQVSQIHGTYPASGSGTLNQYAADYVKFINLGNTYDIFVFIPQNLTENATASYSYTGRLGSFLLSVGGLNDTTVASGVKEGSSSPTPAVLPTLSPENTISTTSSGGDSGSSSGTQFTQYAGIVSMSGTTLTSQATAYAPLGSTFLDGSHVGPLTISATVNERVSINGTYSGVGDSGTISLTYDSRYERPSSIANIQGTWQVNDAALGTVQFVISPAGAVTGSTGTGCVITGNFSIINSTYNAYQVDISLSNCGTANGAYSGLATLTDTSALHCPVQ